MYHILDIDHPKILPHIPEVLNVKKSLIKIAQNMLNFGRRIKIF
jgi:hypothetical protein